MLDRALVEIGERRRDGFDLSVAVNLSPADLLDLGLPSEVLRVLELRDFPASSLRLEVSEDAVMADPERSLEVLRGLRSIGVATSLDDFGSGHVSLGHLKHLGVDEIKIDRSFVMRLADDARDAAIVHTTVDLGRRLGMKVVAEGVETVEAWDTLAGLQVRRGAGLLPRAPDDGHRAGGLDARPRRRLTARLAVEKLIGLENWVLGGRVRGDDRGHRAPRRACGRGRSSALRRDPADAADHRSVAVLVAAAGLVWKRQLGILLVLGGAISLAYGLSGSERAARRNTAVCVILLGAGLLCLDRRPGWPTRPRC